MEYPNWLRKPLAVENEASADSYGLHVNGYKILAFICSVLPELGEIS